MKKNQLEDLWRHVLKIEFETFALKELNPISAKIIQREVNRLKAQIQLLTIKTTSTKNEGIKND